MTPTLLDVPPHPAWPGTTWGPIIEIGYPYEMGCEYRYDCAVYAGTVVPGPTVPVIAATSTDSGAMGVANPIPGPSGVTAGDLLVAFAALDGGGGADPGITAPPGWVLLATAQQPTVVRLSCWARVADLTADDELLLTSGGPVAARFCATIHRVVDHGVVDVTTDIDIATVVATSGNIDPPNLDTGTATDRLWLAVAALDRIGSGYSITAMPTGYAEVVSFNSGATTTDTNLAVAQRALATQAENPATFTNTSWYSAAFTVAVSPGMRGPVENPGRYGPWWQWVRVDCEAQSATIVRGASSPAERIASGSATVTLTDPDGTYAPWRQDAAGERINRANLPLRISITDGETVWPLYFGWVDVWNDVDAWDEPGTVTITASDGMKHLALLDQGATGSQGAGEAAGARISRVLDRAGWQDRAPRHLSTGTIALQATTLAGPALDEIQLVADTEAGAVWIDVEGTFRFVDRNWLRTAAGRRPWLIGDASLTAPGAACASAIVSVADDMAIQNVIGVAKVGGTQSWVEDAASIAKYGRHTWNRTDLPYLNDADTATILAVQLADRSARDYFLQAVVLSPLTEESAWPIVANVDLFDTVLVTRTRGGRVLEEYASVIGIDHTLGPAEMVTVLSLGPRLRVGNARYDVDHYDVAAYSGT